LFLEYGRKHLACFYYLPIVDMKQRSQQPRQGLSIKDVRSQGVSSADKGIGGSLDVDIRTFWCKKHRIFRNLWCVRTEKKEGECRTSAHILRTRRRGSIFRDFVRTSFTDGSLDILQFFY